MSTASGTGAAEQAAQLHDFRIDRARTVEERALVLAPGYAAPGSTEEAEALERIDALRDLDDEGVLVGSHPDLGPGEYRSRGSARPKRRRRTESERAWSRSGYGED